jgi:hypothetical protein
LEVSELEVSELEREQVLELLAWGLLLELLSSLKVASVAPLGSTNANLSEAGQQQQQQQAAAAVLLLLFHLLLALEMLALTWVLEMANYRRWAKTRQIDSLNGPAEFQP